MKDNFFILFFFFFFFFFFSSCKTKEERSIQTTLNSLQGDWKVENFTVAGKIADSLKTFLKTGTLTFNSCEYRSKKFANQADICGGQATINGTAYDLSHRFFSTSTSSFFAIRPTINSPNSNAVNQLFYGQWEISLSENTLIARQVMNVYLPDCQVTFNATRK